MAVIDRSLRDLVGEEWAEIYSALCELDEKRPWMSLWQTLTDFRRNLDDYRKAQEQMGEAD